MEGRGNSGQAGLPTVNTVPRCVYATVYQLEPYKMDLQIAKWGNSLALRIPAEYVQVDLTIDVGL